MSTTGQRRTTQGDGRRAIKCGMNDRPEHRIIFLDHLRAIACLLVVFGHIYLMGFNGYKEMLPWIPGLDGLLFGPDAVQRNIFTAPLLAVALNAGINVGALGISLFFLISGFVILRAVERETPLVFLIRRVFRIYPVSIACVAVAAAATAWYCSAAGVASPNTTASLAASALVFNGPTGTFPALPVTWSLEVELIFYCVMAGLAATGRLGFRALLVLCGICALVTLALNAPNPVVPPTVTRVLAYLSFSTFQIPYLLVGAMLYRMTTAGDRLRGIVYTALSFGLFLLARLAYQSQLGNRGGVDLVHGLWALVIFGAALWHGMKWHWLRPLRWVADISYPLYLVHAPLAWIVLAVLARHGWGMASAGLIAGGVVILAAWLIHISIESPGRRLGAAITKRRTAAGSLQPAAAS
jgi:peptidoglycan/LPS O-acetylase OafA/YrhL